jgi:hypothetical protein
MLRSSSMPQSQATQRKARPGGQASRPNGQAISCHLELEAEGRPCQKATPPKRPSANIAPLAKMMLLRMAGRFPAY